jgi:hypothetical protein
VKFVNSLLTRLISKKIWKTASLWEGFIRLIKVWTMQKSVACDKRTNVDKLFQITQPNSFFVLLQLPRVQLHNLLASTPALQAPLLSWIEEQESKSAVQKLTQSQQNSVQYIVSILKPPEPTEPAQGGSATEGLSAEPTGGVETT